MRDLSDTAENLACLSKATSLLDSGANLAALLDDALAAPEKTSAVELTALYNARSKQALARALGAAQRPIHLTVVLAMYNETQRMAPRSADNPHGQDFIRTKVAQLTWLFALDTSLSHRATWQLLLVDDASENSLERCFVCSDDGGVLSVALRAHACYDSIENVAVQHIGR